MIIWLASYPKSGNTWLRSLLSSYYFSEKGDFNFDLLKKIYGFPAKSFFTEYKNELNNVDDSAQYWISAQNKISSIISHFTSSDFTFPCDKYCKYCDSMSDVSTISPPIIASTLSIDWALMLNAKKLKTTALKTLFISKFLFSF